MHRSPVQRTLAIVVTGLVLIATLITTLFVTQTHAAAVHPSLPLVAPPVTANGNGLGAPPFYTLVSGRCGCYHKGVRVNVADGNLVVQATDLHIKGTGIDLSIGSTYNSLAGTTLNLGQNWVLGIGGDVALHVNGDGSVNYMGPDGYAALFTLSGGIFTDAPGLDATLVKLGGGTYTLTFHKTGAIDTFAANGSLSAQTDQNGNAITYAYNGAGQLASLSDTQGRTTTFTPNASGDIATITDPTSRTVVYGYDTSNRLTSSTDLNGKKTTFGYTGSDLTSITDPLSNLTTIVYDTSHRVTKITDAVSSMTTFGYPTSTTTTVTDANSHVTTYTYDGQGRVTSTKDALGHIQSTRYTPNSNVSQYTDALSNQSVFTWSTDGKNNLMSTTDGSGVSTSYGYTDSSHVYYPSSQTDGQSNQVSYTYNSQGNLTTSTDHLSSQNTLTDTYNSNGTVATAKDANGNTTTSGYDSHGNLTSVTPPSPLGATTLGYDSLSRVTSVTDGKHQKTTYTYDKLDRITKITYADSSTITYTFDADGNVLTLVDSTGTTSFISDGVNQVTKKTLPGAVTISTTFDAVGNLATVTDSGGKTTYAYDVVNRLQTLTESGGAQTTYAYDNANRRTGVSYPNGVTQTLGYDAAGHEISIIAKKGATTLTSYTYSYTNPATSTVASLRYRVTDGVSGNVTSYGYDVLNRLTDATVATSGGTKLSDDGYQYDGAGNRTQHTTLSSTETATFNAANELTTTSGGGTFGYDGNGNETSGSDIGTLAYNVLNQTTSITAQSALTFTYTGPTQAQRVTSGSTTFSYDGLGLNSRNRSGSVTSYITDNRGNLVAEHTVSGTYYYLFDGLGSVVALTDNTGAVVGTYSYDAFGQTTSSASDVATANPWRYAAGYYDGLTNLYKFGVRYYDPSLGRWTQQDPIAGSLFDPSTGNRYAYTNDNPTNLTDPTGASFLGSLGALVGGFFTGAASAYVPFALGVFGLTAPIAAPTLAVVVVSGILLGSIADIAYNFVTSLGLV